jgi:hypothetical protein
MPKVTEKEVGSLGGNGSRARAHEKEISGVNRGKGKDISSNERDKLCKTLAAALLRQ